VRAAQTHMDRSGLTTGASETGCDGGGEHRLRLPTHLFLQLHVYAFAAQLRSMENEQESPARRIGRSMTAAAARGWRDVRAETIPRPSLSLFLPCVWLRPTPVRKESVSTFHDVPVIRFSCDRCHLLSRGAQPVLLNGGFHPVPFSCARSRCVREEPRIEPIVPRPKKSFAFDQVNISFLERTE
jgi:hypothetical protein